MPLRRGKAEESERIFDGPAELPCPTDPMPNQRGPGPTEPRRKPKKCNGVSALRPNPDRSAHPVVKRHLSVYDEG